MTSPVDRRALASVSALAPARTLALTLASVAALALALGGCAPTRPKPAAPRALQRPVEGEHRADQHQDQDKDRTKDKEHTAMTAPTTSTSSLTIPDVTRPARFAGSWYEGDPAKLRAQLEGWLKDAATRAAGAEEPTPVTSWDGPAPHLLGVIAPHAGYRYSGRVAASSYRLVREAKPKRIFVMGPSHHVAMRGVALVMARRFDTPLGPLTIDTEALQALARHPLFLHGPDAVAADAHEHSVEMQMPFLRLVAPDAKVVPLIVGRLTLPEVAKVAEQLRAVLRPGDLVVASSDFTHYGPNYGYTPFGTGPDTQRSIRDMDHRAWRFMSTRDIEGLWRFKAETEDTICGFTPISILLALLPSSGLSSALVRYDTSGHLTGDTTNSVSYVAGAFAASRDWASGASAGAGAGAGHGANNTTRGAAAQERPDPALEAFGGQDFLTLDEQRVAVSIARAALEAFVRRGETLDPRAAGLLPAGYEGRLTEPHGVFVTLNEKANGHLRGCIGDLAGRRPLVDNIVANAINAAVHDPRFRPVRAEELPRLAVEVTVLTPMTPVPSKDAILLGRDGVLLSYQGRRAVYLPQVPIEAGWGLRRTLEHLARKAGFSASEAHDVIDKATYETFRGFVYEELPD